MTETKQTNRVNLVRLAVALALMFALIVLMMFNQRTLNHRQDQLRVTHEHIGALQLQAQALDRAAVRVSAGDVQALADMQRASDLIGAHVAHLQGKPVNMPGMSPERVEIPTAMAALQVKKIASVWGNLHDDVNVILSRRSALNSAYDLAKKFNAQVGTVSQAGQALVDRLVADGAPPTQVNAANRQLLELQRLRAAAGQVLKGDSDAASAAKQFGDDAVRVGQDVNALLAGDRERGVARVTDPAARAKLSAVASGYTVLNGQVAELLKDFPTVLKARNAAPQLLRDSARLVAEASTLSAVLQRLANPGPFSYHSVFLPGILSGIVLIIIGLMLIVPARRQQAEAERLRIETEDVNRRTQSAILTLLDEMSTLADGDLTTKATVTEEITGAIADSVNYAIDQLRELVSTINATSAQVARAARQTRATAVNLAEASDHQAHQITSASTAITQMAGSIEDVSKHAQESATVAKRSVDIALKGADTVQRTIHGMDAIREQIQETSKRIKRLGESSQEIGAIVGLINDIADQTNILALNAAIQAAMAGEAGRGFAVVADEVQRLAERSTDATKQIEALIKTIQTDTNEAVHSMEQSTAGVVAGAKLAEDAGVALTEIENVSNRLYELVTNISDASVQQSRAASEVSNTMNVIQDITAQVSQGSSETAESIGNLTELAGQLHKSVAGFKLPAAAGEADEAVTVVGEEIPELGDEAVVEPAEADLVSMSGSEADELDLMAELSGLQTTVELNSESLDGERKDDQEVSAQVLEELAAELEATGDTELDVDLGGKVGAKASGH